MTDTPEPRPALGQDFGTTLCDILGIDKERSHNIIITVPANSVATVEVHQWLYDDDAERVATKISHYQLTPAEPPDTEG